MKRSRNFKSNAGSTLIEALIAGGALIWFLYSAASIVQERAKYLVLREAKMTVEQVTAQTKAILADTRPTTGGCVLSFENTTLNLVPLSPDDNRINRIVAGLKPNQANTPSEKANNVVYDFQGSVGNLSQITADVSVAGCATRTGANQCQPGVIQPANNDYLLEVTLRAQRVAGSVVKNFENKFTVLTKLTALPGGAGYRVAECLSGISVGGGPGVSQVDFCASLGGTMVPKFGAPPGTQVCNVLEPLCAAASDTKSGDGLGVGTVADLGSGRCIPSALGHGLFGNFGPPDPVSGLNTYTCPVGKFAVGITKQGRLVCTP